jgi:hypothetical protein
MDCVMAGELLEIGVVEAKHGTVQRGSIPVRPNQYLIGVDLPKD